MGGVAQVKYTLAVRAYELPTTAAQSAGLRPRKKRPRRAALNRDVYFVEVQNFAVKATNSWRPYKS